MHRVRQQAGSYEFRSWSWNVASEMGMALLPRPVIAACIVVGTIRAWRRQH